MPFAPLSVIIVPYLRPLWAFSTALTRPATDSRQNPALAALCAAVSVLATLLALPFVEMGLGDDWAYTRTARDLAETGRFVYHGWATTMVGAQALWGALFVKLLGFSFTAVRLSALPFVAGCGALLYLLARRWGLNARWAVFGALSVTTAPVYLPLAASFATDIPGFFFFLLSLWAAVRAADAEKSRGFWGFLLLCTLAGAVGGTIRQALWLCPLLWLPLVAATRRTEKGVWAGAGLLWLLTAAGLGASLLWFTAQPYSVPESIGEGVTLFVRSLPFSLLLPLPWGLSLAWFALPALLTLTLARKKENAALKLVPVALLLLLFVGLPFALLRDGAIAPYMKATVTRWGVNEPYVTVAGERPVVLPLFLSIPFSLATLACLALLSPAAWAYAKNWRSHLKDAAPPYRLPLLLWGAFVAVYLVLLLPRATQSNVFDRYLIPTLPLVLFPVLHAVQTRGILRPPPYTLALLALYGLYGVAATQEYIAQCRARVAAASAVIRSGVPRREVSAGLEYDAWTQADITGYLNDNRIRVPRPVYREPVSTWPDGSPYNFWRWTPDVQPRYFVVLSGQKGMKDAPFPPVRYVSFLPPFVRQVRVQEKGTP